jgi:hypothetical protein
MSLSSSDGMSNRDSVAADFSSGGVVLAINSGSTRISCHGAPPMSACAAFIKESRMEFANANNVYRKSGSSPIKDRPNEAQDHSAIIARTPEVRR